jgi:hypothetical protein
LQNIVNILPYAFTNYKGVTKSWNHVVNAPERMEVPKKTIQTPSVMKTRPLQKMVNVSQPVVDRHLVDINMPQSSTQACYINENASMSKNPDTLILGNHEESNGIEEISINYTSSREVDDCSTIVVSSSFSIIITENILADPDHKTMVECKECSD